MGTPALHTTSGQLVDVIDEREELSFVKFPDGKCIWVKAIALDFENLDTSGLDDDWGPENDDDLGFNNPDEYFEIDSGDHYDIEYDRP